MSTKALEEIFNRNIKPALEITDAEAKLFNGMSEETAKKHRDFFLLDEEEKKNMVLAGDI